MSDESKDKASKPDAAQKSHDAAQMAASIRDCPRAGRRGFDPQLARQIAWGE